LLKRMERCTLSGIRNRTIPFFLLGSYLMLVQCKRDTVGDPGKGFYEYARELGVYRGSDDLGFWAKEVKWLHKYWSSH